MSPAVISPLASIKALTFDVFGTVVAWRATVTEELSLRAHRKVTSPSVSTSIKERLDIDWGDFAQQWRNSYGTFTKGFDPDKDAWKSVDEHHRDSLVTLLAERGLEGVYNDAEIESLSLVWHRLLPHEDSSAGLSALSKRYDLATLSNGNTSLLRDLVDYSPDPLPFDHLLSAETFGAYKPHPNTYLGAARELGVDPSEVAMVAAHLGDLESARRYGLRTIYIERQGEEVWAEEEPRYAEARKWVDLWVGREQEGIKTIARALEDYDG